MATTKTLRNKQSAAKGMLRPAAANGSGGRPAPVNIRSEPKANAPSQQIRTF